MTRYRVTPLWWPDGWEPGDPLDVPKCVRPAHGQPASGPPMDYRQAVATIQGLNRQNLDHPGATWYVVSEAEEAGSPPRVDIAGVLAGAAERPIRVVVPEGGSRGDCSHCPAGHGQPCTE
jgi:hypothetical protein